ncbi:sensor histidine kinase [Jeotgalibacillus sp. JSM ZJ347]|uniref:sensor histidine kinase n=1 Tax=Jeotgalibacillus sp. JSM ZJ347 TaxID=3342117 RepID=UPI0035A944B8
MKRLFHTIYGRFLIIFIGLLFIPMIISFTLLFTIQLDRIREDVELQLTDQGEILQTLVTSESFTAEEAVELVIGNILVSRSYDSIAAWRNAGEADYTDEQINQLEDGQVITGALSDFRELPYAAFELGGEIYMISPNLNNNQITQFRNTTIYSFLAVALIGSILILFAISFLTRRLDRISKASRQVYEGNYTVRIQDKGTDEIGDLARQFNQMAEELETNEYLNKELSAVMAHEFKTPVSSMIGFAALLKKMDVPDEKRIEYALVIEREAKRLARLSSTLLKLSKFDHKLVHMTKSHYQLDEQIRECLLMLQPQWEEKQLELEIDLMTCKWTGDRELMSQVWINIMKNAVEHSPQHGKLIIRTDKSDDEMIVRIQDTGEGIAPEHIERIFERFYQVDRTRSAAGTGLGLALVRKIIDLHGGEVRVQSKMGEGTVLTVVLPFPEKDSGA